MKNLLLTLIATVVTLMATLWIVFFMHEEDNQKDCIYQKTGAIYIRVCG